MMIFYLPNLGGSMKSSRLNLNDLGLLITIPLMSDRVSLLRTCLGVISLPNSRHFPITQKDFFLNFEFLAQGVPGGKKPSLLETT